MLRICQFFLLLLEAATLGVFCALDTIQFFFCWEFTLLPLYFLVSLWGVAADRQAAGVRYFLVMLAEFAALMAIEFVMVWCKDKIKGTITGGGKEKAVSRAIQYL